MEHESQIITIVQNLEKRIKVLEREARRQDNIIAQINHDKKQLQERLDLLEKNEQLKGWRA